MRWATVEDPTSYILQTHTSDEECVSESEGIRRWRRARIMQPEEAHACAENGKCDAPDKKRHVLSAR